MLRTFCLSSCPLRLRAILVDSSKSSLRPWEDNNDSLNPKFWIYLKFNDNILVEILLWPDHNSRDIFRNLTNMKQRGGQLGKGAENQNGNLRWHLPIGVRPPPPPLNGKISRHFFTPLFFFCNWVLHIWNGFYTSKISLLSPLIIGSKLTFISSSGRWLPTI